MKTAEEMTQIFADLPAAISATMEIANKVEFYDIDACPMLPVFQIPDSFGNEEKYRSRLTEGILRNEFKNSYFHLDGYEKLIRVKLEADYLAHLTMEGAKFRFGEALTAEQSERIAFELDAIKTMGFPDYFLVVQEIVSAARDMKVYVGPGFGSAAGSMVAYCLHITNIDPLKHGLLFERFLNPDRLSMPYFELDFDEEGLRQVFCWLQKRYGKERVARIITYGKMNTKSSLLDMARVQGLPQNEADRLIKLIPEKFPDDTDGYRPKVNIPNCIKYIPELRDARNSEDKCLSDTLKYAAMLEGTLHSTAVSPCGVVIGSEDLINLVPLSTAIDKETNEQILVTQYESRFIDEIGLVEFNFWGLKNLSVIKEALSKIKISKGIELDIEAIPNDDSKTYQHIGKGFSTSTFRYVSAKMQKELQVLQPTQFEDLIAMYVLCRPGLEQQLSSFINRKNGVEKIEYPFPEMEKVLKNSYGILLYQEQMMMLSRLLAGFTVGESLDLWRAMGKQLHDKKAALKVQFIRGCEKNGFGPRPKLEQIWNDWAVNAKYNCLKSYATCSAWIIYQTAYLEAHYPDEFKAAMSTYNRENHPAVGMCIDEYKYQLS